MKLTRRGRVVTVLVIVGLLLLILGGATFAYLNSIGLMGDSDPGEPVQIVIPRGASAEEIGSVLEENEVIPSAFGFRVALYLDGGYEDIQAGRYELFEGLNARDALAILTRGALPDEFVSVTFPEGSWLTDFARIVERETHISGDRFLELATSGRVRSRLQPASIDTLEGLVFPSTYQVVERDTAETVLRRLVGEFDRRAEEILENKRPLGLSPYEVAIVASMVEAEAKVESERAKVAAVIYNRLRAGMQLGIDATVLYAIGEHKTELTRSDLAVDSPYNTRIHTGLPPTPIGAPGMASLEAAADPAVGDWLYYVVADCAGHHAFSVDYDDFLADKARYQALDC